jgi:hypothetical protein
MQTWSLSHLQKLLLNTIKNPFPIGFIYVQLPKEKSPTEIWSWMIWKDVTSDYAGLFFRAEGGEAVSFGQIQQESAPRLVEVNTHLGSLNPELYDAATPVGAWSNYVFTGAHPGAPPDDHMYIKFQMSDGEVRPRNMAIRVWKRTG